MQNSVFTGTVTDPTGGVVPKATVTATNVGTNISTTVETNRDGLYRLSELPPAVYNLEVTATGFKTISQQNIRLNAGTVQRVDFRLELGAKTERVTVEAAPPLVNTEDIRLSETVSGTQVANLPLNGRNLYDLLTLAPGAEDVRGVMFENGHGTVVNGLRENFNGFLLNGVSNKGLSGGPVTVVNPDIVQEFQMLTLNMSAQYGNSASSITNVVTKSGTNDYHGDAYGFIRNDRLDANTFFHNRGGIKKQPLRFGQFGVTATGPIKKNKLFFSASYQGDRFLASAPPIPFLVESPAWRQAIVSINSSNPSSVAALIYKNFPSSVTGTADKKLGTLTNFVTSGKSGESFTDFWNYMCPALLDPAGLNPTAANALATKFQNLFGVNSTDIAGLTGGTSANPNCATYFGTSGPAARAGQLDPFGGRGISFFNDASSVIPTQSVGNLFDGHEWSTRIDYQMTKNDRMFGEFYWQRTQDQFGPSNITSVRGFKNPTVGFFPNFQYSWVHIFNERWVNEFRAGYTQNTSKILTGTPGVPSVGFGDGSIGFGSYNGYPQLFRENIFSYSDMVSASKGKHSLKMGVDFRRNYENSEFNVARPSYYFFDQLFFAVDAPAEQVAGVDPGIVSGQPAELSSNVRYWRNLEMGAYFQDDWKVRRNLTLSLGLRYDLYTRHTEKNGLVTTFIPGPGSLTRANGIFLEWVKNANLPKGGPGCNTSQQIAQAQLAGVCGPGGFAAARNLGRGNYKNFGPRVGVAWDVFGNGKTAIRGGWGISYEGTLYNPLSNSRWNLPFYSFNIADNFLLGDVSNPIYGPVGGGAVTFTGPAPPAQHSGSGAQATGNIDGWDPTNANLAFLTGIVFPDGIRDPRVQNWYFGIQQQVMPHTVLEVNYVGTRGRNLFRAENANRQPGGRLPAGTCVNAQGRTECSLIGPLNPVGRLNPNYGTLRVWENVSRSWYQGLQVSARRQMAQGLLFNVNYTYSHSIDTGSDWHSGATSANGAAAGDGFSLDQTRPFLDKGNSTFDIRHRVVFNYVWELPWFKSQQGFIGHILGGWEYNGIWSYQTGAHWTPYISSPRRLSCTNPADATTCVNNGGDFNLDSIGNDRPNAPNGNNITGNTNLWANGYFPGGQFNAAYCSPANLASGKCTKPFFGTPCLGCNGNLGRNTFVGPPHFNTDQSVFKTVKFTERYSMEFRAEIFNAFNHPNFLLPSSSTGANFANRITSGIFGASAGTLDPREIQFGLKIFW